MKRKIETVDYRPSSDTQVARAALRLSGGNAQVAAWMTGSTPSRIVSTAELPNK